MQINTTRFGPVQIEHEDIIDFPAGLIGLEAARQWVLLADANNAALGWLQSTTRPELALAVVSPRRFVPSYQVRLPGSELAPLELRRTRDAGVLVVVGKHGDTITLNLKAPLIVNTDRRLGRQVVNNADEPIAYPLEAHSKPLRKSA